MSNLIDRQAAIDEIQSVYDFEYPTASGAFDEFVTMIIPNIIKNMPSAQPEQNPDEWCTDCKEYDQTKHCCPRFNKVIKNTLKDTQSTTHKNAHWTNIQISVDGTSCECSLCGAIVHSSFSDKIRYCPNCGAYMLGDVLTLDSPVTEKQCYTITDVDFDNTREIIFRTKHGEEIKFVKESPWISCDERLPEDDRCVFLQFSGLAGVESVIYKHAFSMGCYYRDSGKWFIEKNKCEWDMNHMVVEAWMPMPKRYNLEKVVK